jgi:Flp pilus assembly pilin Flp
MVERSMGLLRDTRGAIFTEYLVIMGFVALATAPAVLYCAWAVATHFARVRWYILCPFP